MGNWVGGYNVKLHLLQSMLQCEVTLVTNLFFHKVQSLKTSLSEVVMNITLPFSVKSNRLDMRASRKKLNEFWNKLDFVLNPKPLKFDTILGLTGAEISKKSPRLSTEDKYGISGLRGACGDGKR